MSSVGKGAAFLYIETVTSMVSGYLFWLILSKITSPEIIGTSSAIVSIATIFVTVAAVGIPNGIQRFLGRYFTQGDIKKALGYFSSSLILMSFAVALCSAVLLLFNGWIDEIFNIDYELIIISIFLIGSSTFATLFRAVIISLLRTKILLIVIIISSSSKLAIAIILVIAGMGSLGLVIGYTSNQIIASVMLASVLAIIFKNYSIFSARNISDFSRQIMIASSVSWIPAIITTVGTQLGTILVFGSHGASDAGVYFIAFSVVTAIMGIIFSLFTIAYPVLSGMEDGRKRFTWKAIKMSLFLALPFSTSLIFYSEEIMNLLGKDYVVGSFSLEILLLSMLPVTLFTGINSLSYAYGKYRQVLIIGMASSVPRTILYFILVPLLGSAGAAIGFTAGSFIGLGISLFIARNIGLKIYWRDIIMLGGLPVLLGYSISFTPVHFVIGITITVISSYLLFINLRILAISEIKESINILPKKISVPIVNIVERIDRLRR